MEQFIVYRAAAKKLQAAGVNVVDSYAGELLTVQEQAGFQMILAKLDDDHMDLLKNYKADAPYWKRFGK